MQDCDEPKRNLERPRSRPSVWFAAGVAFPPLAALAAIVLWDHLQRGGFVQDDWWLQSLYAVPPYPSRGGIETLLSAYGDRPGLAFYVTLVHSVLGEHIRLHIVWTVAVAIAVAAGMYGILRSCGVDVVGAGAIAALTLLFPGSDSALLWATAASYHWAMLLFLLGLAASITARGQARSRRRVVLRLSSLLLYAIAVLTVEVMFGVVLITFLAYRAAEMEWRTSLRWGALDAVVGTGALAIIALRTPRLVGNRSEQVDHVGEIFDQTRQMIEGLGIIDGPRRVSVVALLVVVAFAWALTRLLAKNTPLHDGVHRATAILVLGLVILVAAYAAYVPAAAYYSPASPGLANRVNAVAAPGFAFVLYGIGAVVASLLNTARAGAVAGPALAAIGATALGLAWADRIRDDAALYDESFAVQQRSVDFIITSISDPPANVRVFTFGLPAQTGRRVPIFFASWDLTGALRLKWRRADVIGIPSTTVTAIACGADRIRPVGPLYNNASATRYGSAIFVHVSERSVYVPQSRTSCRSRVKRLLPMSRLAQGTQPVPEQLAITPWTLPTATSGAAYRVALRAAGGHPPYAWTVDAASQVAPGLRLSRWGEIAGKPAAPGAYEFVVVVVDSYGARGSASVRVRITPSRRAS